MTSVGEQLSREMRERDERQKKANLSYLTKGYPHLKDHKHICRVAGCDNLTDDYLSVYCYLHKDDPDRDKITNIYFIIGVGTDRVKIGQAIDPEARLRDLQIGSPVPLVMAASVSMHQVTEFRLHRVFKGQRSHGEWFFLTDEIIDLIEGANENGKEFVEEFLKKAEG